MSFVKESDGRGQKLLGLVCVAALACAMWFSARSGLSRLFSKHGMATASLASAQTAVALNPADPEAHYALAVALADHDRLDEALPEFERSIKLNSRDYFLWLKLGRAFDWSGNSRKAQDAFQVAAGLAPFYAQPHWELGNSLLRAGQRERAFVELRRAAESNAALEPAVIDLAWNAYTGDTEKILRAVDPQTPEAQLALARYFAQHSKLAESLEGLRAAGNDAADVQRHALLKELLDGNHFVAAHQVWLSGNAASTSSRQDGEPALTDGSFESQLARDEDAGFGWRLADESSTGVKAALDLNEPRAGNRSLRLDWSGDSHPAIPIISQLVMVEPGARYRLSFAARTQDLVSGGLPFVAVIDAADKDGSLLGQSSILPRDGGEWRDYGVEFTSGKTTNAVVILLRRQCATTPCPIFGRVWLDDFSLRKL